MYLKRVGFIVVAVVTIFLLSSFIPTQAAIVPGIWRDINPTQYSADTTGTLNGIYVRNGGSGAIGAGDGWAVGGDSGTPIIAHYDGFSWLVLANIRTPAVYESVNLCTSPGAPGVGLCSPNGDGSDGWIVGGDGGSPGAPVAIYWDGSTLTDETSSLPPGSTGTLNSVFVVCHFDGSGCPSGGAFGAGVAYAAGTDGTNAVIYAFNGNPKGSTGHWNLEYTTGLTSAFNGIYMFQNSAGNLEGFAVGGNVVARGVGTTWVSTTLPGAVNLRAVFVASNSPTVWAVGDSGQIWYFNGSVWGLVTPFPATTDNLYGIALVSTSEGWIVGHDSIILHSTNLGSGNVWTALTNTIQTGTGPGIDLHSVSFSGSGNGWADGTQGVILQTANSGCGSVTSPCWGGSTSIVQSTSVQSLNSVFELGSSDAWAGGSFDTTSNTFSLIHWDGIKWHRASVTGTPTDVMGIYMSGSGDGWAVGGDTGTHSAVAIHWDGNGWNQGTIATCGANCYLNSVFMISGGSGGDGWAVGTMGIFWRFQSGSWTSLGTACNSLVNDFNSVFINNPGSGTSAGWAVGNSGTVCVLKIVGGTPTWSQQSIPGITSQNLYGVYFKDSNHGWIVGDHATIVTTDNGGASWSGGANQVNGAPTTTVLRSVFVDTLGTGSGNGDGWAVGDDGSGSPPNPVFALFNGAGWTAIPIAPPLAGNVPPSNLALHSVYLTSPTDGWAVGAGINYASTPLAGIFHLDPPNPPIVQGGTTSTNVVTSSPIVTTSSSTSSSSITTSSTESSVTSSGSTSSVTASVTSPVTTQVGTSVQTSAASSNTIISTPTTTSSSATVSTPMVLPAIPGFPWVSIIAGMIIGLAALATIRRHRHLSHKHDT
jgi:photosystem II stability/assembly factor-like uncharacterized protein